MNGEVKRMRLEQKFWDFGTLPRAFKYPHECIDYYNDLSY
jgi:hypothetical protein